MKELLTSASAVRKLTPAAVDARLKTALKQEEMNLNARRQKLRDLFAEEKASYALALEGLKETAEQHHNRILTHAKLLHEEGEREREELAKQLMHRRWRDGCDELRARDSKLNCMSMKHTRDQQIAAASAHKLECEARDKELNKMWVADWEKKKEREVNEKERARAMIKDTQLSLTSQIKDKQMVRLTDQKERDEEADLMKEQWELENITAVRREEARRHAADHERIRQNVFNVVQREVRVKARREEREQDLRLIDAYVEAEKAKDLKDQQEKLRIRGEAEVYRKYLFEQMKKDEEFEHRLDRMRKQQQDKEWEKQQERWDREDAARRQLMAEVIADRHHQIQERLEFARQRKEQEAILRDRLLVQNDYFKVLDRHAVVATAQRNRRHQADIAAQIDERKYQVYNDVAKKQYEGLVQEKSLREREYMVELEMRKGFTPIGETRQNYRQSAQWTY